MVRGEDQQSTISGAVSGVQSVAFDKIGALFNAGDIDSYTAFAVHAALGAAGAAAQGGDVVASLLTSGVSKAFSLTTRDFLAGLSEDAVQVLSVAIVGGTVSALTGGKFGNGAFLAGFAYAINQLQALAMARIKPAQRGAQKTIELNTVKEKTLTSMPGESMNDFLKRVGMYQRAHADTYGFEYCGNVCVKGSSTTVEVVTNESHIGCLPPRGTASCPVGYTDTTENIHVHGVDKSVRVNESDIAVLILSGTSARNGRVSGQNLNDFSELDLNNNHPDYLYTGDNRLLYEDNMGNIKEIK